MVIQFLYYSNTMKSAFNLGNMKIINDALKSDAAVISDAHV